jgi:hypothetical protein
MRGARNIVTGIDFNGGSARVEVYGINNKFIGNKIRNWTSTRAIMTGNSPGQTKQEISYNEIGPPGGPPTAIRFGVKSDTSSDPSTVPTNVWVHHNYFHGFPDGNGNDTDAMEPGNSNYPFASSLASGWYIEDNLFSDMQDCNQALIDMKFGGSVMRRNTVTDSCNVKIQSRFGSNAIWESNYITDGQIMVNGRGHKIVCNTITGGSGIRVNAGEKEWDFSGKDEHGNSPHNRSLEVLVAGNTGPLVVGYQPNSNYDLQALDTIIESHNGSISLDHEDRTIDNRNNASSYKCMPAVRLTTNEVGPGAVNAALPEYRAARGL